MAKRTSDEERVVNFFNQAEYAKASTVFNISRGIMKGRAEENQSLQSLQNGLDKVSKPRKTRVKKVKPSSSESKSTSFPGEVDAGSAA